MSAIRWLAACVVVTAAVVLAGPTAAWADGGCEKDTECKGDRVCDAGRCVAPAAAAGAPANPLTLQPEPAPAPALAPAPAPAPTAATPDAAPTAAATTTTTIVRNKLLYPGWYLAMLIPEGDAMFGAGATADLPLKQLGEHLVNHFGMGVNLMFYTGDAPVSLFIGSFALTVGVRYEADGLSVSARGGAAVMMTTMSYDDEALAGLDAGDGDSFGVAGTISADLHASYFFVGGEVMFRSGSTSILRFGLAF